MTKKKPIEWTRLDNAAKIFPPNTNKKDTKVFRFLCELKEDVDRDILQKALENTIALFPLYRTVLRKGVFWYYFESTELMPEVKEEEKHPCSMLYYPNRKNLLFEVTYYKKRINLEVYHALTDGTGALGFLKTLLFYYITMRYQDDFKDKLPVLDYDATLSQKMDDSFSKHYSGNTIRKKIKLRKAYRIAGRRSFDNSIKVIEGVMPVKEVLAQAHRYNTTLTVYLTSLLLYSIYQEMPVRGRRYPVVLSIPVNLRSYFPSVTARNFFGTINVSYHFGKNKNTLEDIISEVRDCFQRELTEEKLKDYLNRYASWEHNAFARIIPLCLKDIVLRIISHCVDRGITASLSNIGKITMVEELSSYVQMFNCFTSVRRPQICMCSYNDQMVISFASPFISTDLQKNFFRMLSEQDINITVISNTQEDYI